MCPGYIVRDNSNPGGACIVRIGVGCAGRAAHKAAPSDLEALQEERDRALQIGTWH